MKELTIRILRNYGFFSIGKLVKFFRKKNPLKKSHFTRLGAKRATFIFWKVQKSYTKKRIQKDIKKCTHRHKKVQKGAQRYKKVHTFTKMYNWRNNETVYVHLWQKFKHDTAYIPILQKLPSNPQKRSLDKTCWVISHDLLGIFC